MNQIAIINCHTLDLTNSHPDLADEIADLSRQFLATLKKSAQASLDLAQTVLSAHKLGEAAFAMFCKRIGYTADASYLRKLKKIGEKVPLFSPFVGSLPPNWTTLYRLSNLSDEKLHSLLANGSITPSMTADELANLVSSCL